jgi:hypothetical protein
VLKTKPSYGNSSSAKSNSAAGSNHTNQHAQPQVSLQISIPDKDVGLCIGRGGCVIKYNARYDAVSDPNATHGTKSW